MMAIMLVQSLAPAQNAKDGKIRELQATMDRQTAQIKNLTAQVAELKAKLASRQTGPTTRPAGAPRWLTPPAATTRPKPKPVPAEIALKRIVDKIDFTDAPLSEVVNFLRKAFNVSIYVNWRQMQKAGVRPITSVSIHVQRVSLRKAIELILDVGPGKLDFEVEEGILRISSWQHFYEKTETKVYDIRPLLRRSPPALFEQIQEIVTRIEETVDPKSWETVGALSRSAGHLVVTQNKRNHAAIAELLKKLRRSPTRR